MIGRKDPCPCGSGKKYKRCCLGNTDYGLCDALGRSEGQRCVTKSCGAVVCKDCGKRYATCHVHNEKVQTLMRGHVLRTHPEKVPAVVDDIMRDEAAVIGIREQARHNPDLWKKLLDYIDKRQARA